jgi:hypothetical protein
VLAYQGAVSEGIDPVAFWSMTPYLTHKATQALADRMNTAAWVAAALTRAKKMPKLEELLTKKKQTAPADLESKFRAMFAAHNAKAVNHG